VDHRKREKLNVRVLPEAKEGIRREAKRRHGSASKSARVLEERYMKSKPYEPTPEQAEDPTLRRCWHERATEAETIQVVAVELRTLRAQLRQYEAQTP